MHPTASRPVHSNQSGPHPALERTVRRHLAHPFRRPPAAHAREAFARLVERADGRPWILDSACGTGESTARLAQRHPEAWVVGIDRSEERLSRGRRKLATALPGNAILLRTDAPDLWHLMAEAGWCVACHYLLYPNPWPKAEHLGRRWQGHPRFADLLRLGGRLELRTNWPVYAQEFAHALQVAGHAATLGVVAAPETEPISPFERKYALSGHTLWRLQAQLPGAPARPGAERQAGNTPVDR